MKTKKTEFGKNDQFIIPTTNLFDIPFSLTPKCISAFLLVFLFASKIDARIVEPTLYSTQWDDPTFLFNEDECISAISGSGLYDSDSGVSGSPEDAEGAPDGSLTGKLDNDDELTLTYRAMDIGGDICVTVGFSAAGGQVEFELNGVTSTFDNSAGLTDYELQEYCLTTTISGSQTLIIRESGSGDIKIDGSLFTGCEDLQSIEGGGNTTGQGNGSDLIDFYDADNPKAYVILASKEVNLKNNDVLSGGVGVWGTGEKIRIENNTTIGAFLRADVLEVKKNSDSPDLIRITSTAPNIGTDVPDYINAGNLSDLTIDKNQPDTVYITGTDYDKIEIEENNTVVFTQDTVYIDKLDIKNGKQNKEIFIDFDQRTVLIIKTELNVGQRVYFNNANKIGVKVFVIDGNATIKDGSVFNGILDSRNGDIDVAGNSEANPTVMKGQFIAERIKADQHVTWELNVETAGIIVPTFPPPAEGKTDEILSSALVSLARANPNPFGVRSDNIYQFKVSPTGELLVLIEVVAIEGKEDCALAFLDGLGITDLIDNGSNGLVISGYLPKTNLPVINTNEECIKDARPIYRPIVDKGVVTSLGDVAQRSDFVREGYSLTGKGTKIGVISDSYNIADSPGSAEIDIQEGDLPTNGVQIISDNPRFTGTDEGRAMLQIIHDIAPEAELAFNTGFVSAGAFAEAIRELKAINCDIIVDDVTYITEPFFTDGLVAQAVDEVNAQGATYVSAAGNYGRYSYSGTFNGEAGRAHVFGTDATTGAPDTAQSITLQPGSYTVSLQWEDDFYSIGQTGNDGTQVDLDIYLYDDAGTKIEYNTNIDNIGKDPFEIMDYSNPLEDSVKVNIVVVNATNGDPVRFKYIFFRGGPNVTFNEFNTPAERGGTIVGQANAVGAIATGAVLYKNTPAIDPAKSPTPASFSSRGGTPVDGVVRNKPDLMGPNGANTTVELGGNPTIDNDEFPNFSGTSAAAPHVAGAIALIKEGRKNFLGLNTGPLVMKQLLQDSAIPMGDPFESGPGFLQTQNVLLGFANPSPEITGYDIDPSAVIPTSGTVQPFEVSIKGKYITASTVVQFGDVTIIPTEIVGDTIIRCTIPTFVLEDRTPLKLFTEAKSTSQIDGGTSNSFAFVDPVKALVKVKAESASKKFGEPNPSFSSTITGLQNDDSLDGLIEFETNAGALSSPGIYQVRVDTVGVPTALTDAYDFKFVSGTVAAERLPIVVQPDSITITYGDPLPGITFSYQFEGNIDDPATLSTAITNTYGPSLEDGIALVDGFTLFNSLEEALALVDGLSEIALVDILEALDEIALVDRAALEQALLNAGYSEDEALALVDGVPIGEELALVDVVKLRDRLDASDTDDALALVDNGQPGRTQRVEDELALVDAINARVTDNDEALALVDVAKSIDLEDALALVDRTGTDLELALVDSGELDGDLEGLALVDNSGKDLELALVDAGEAADRNLPSLALVDGIKLDDELALVDGLDGLGELALVDVLELLPDLALVDKLEFLALVDGLGLSDEDALALVDGIELDGELALVDGVKLRNELNQSNVDAALALVDGSRIDSELALVDAINARKSGNEALALVDVARDLTLDDAVALVDNLVLVDASKLPDGIELALVDSGNDDLELALVDGNNPELALVDNLDELALVDGLKLEDELALVDGGVLVNKSGVISATTLTNSLSTINPESKLNGLDKDEAIALVDAKAVLDGQALTDAFSQDAELALVDNLPIVNALKWRNPPIANSTRLATEIALVDNGPTELALVDGTRLSLEDEAIALVDNSDPENVNSPLDDAYMLVTADETVGALNPINILTGYAAGTHYIIPGTFYTDDYDVSYEPGVVIINPKPITLIVESKEVLPDAPLPNFTSIITGVIAGDILEVTYSVPDYDGSTPGSYDIIAEVNDPNYDIAITTGILTVSCPAPLEIYSDKLLSCDGSFSVVHGESVGYNDDAAIYDLIDGPASISVPAGSNRVLVVGLYGPPANIADITGVSYNGITTSTPVATQTVLTNPTGISFWIIPLGSGEATTLGEISILGGVSTRDLSVASFKNVNQFSPAANSTGQTDVSNISTISIPITAGNNILVDGWTMYDFAFPSGSTQSTYVGNTRSGLGINPAKDLGPLSVTTVTSSRNSGFAHVGFELLYAPTPSPITFSIDDFSNFNTDGIFSGLETGTYTVRAKDSNGCIGIMTEDVIVDRTAPEIADQEPITTYAKSIVGTPNKLYTLPIPEVTDISGINGNALDFDGTDDNVLIDNPSLDINSELTMEAWVYINGAEFGFNTWQNIMRKGSGWGMAVSNNYRDSNNDIVTGLRLRFWNSNAGGLNTPYSSVELTSDEWVHVAVTVDALETKFFVNGVEVGTTEAFNPPDIPNQIVNNTQALALGRQGPFGANYWNGKIDEVRIWNVARSENQIKAAMNRELEGAEAGLLAYYDFDQGNARENNAGETTLIDRTANGNDGILTNFNLNSRVSNWLEGYNSTTLTNNAPATYPVGNTTVRWTATDACGNESTSDVDVTILQDEDATFQTENAIQITSFETVTPRTSPGEWQSFEILETTTLTEIIAPAQVNGTTPMTARIFEGVGIDGFKLSEIELGLFDGITNVIPINYRMEDVVLDPGIYTFELFTEEGAACCTGGEELTWIGDPIQVGDPTSSFSQEPLIDGPLTFHLEVKGRIDDCTQDFTVRAADGDSNVEVEIPLVSANYNGYKGTALDFDGANSHITIGDIDSELENSAELSLECWVNTTDSNYGGFISNRPVSNFNLSQYGLNLQGTAGPAGLSGHAEFWIADGSAYYWVFSDNPINDGEWHHLAVVRDGASITMYVDGVIQSNPNNIFTSGTLTDQPLPTNTNPVVLGRYYSDDPSNNLDGKMDEVRIWNVARTPEEIMRNLNNGLIGNETGLVAYYKFDEGVANGNNANQTQVFDATGDMNNIGTLQNFVFEGANSNFVEGYEIGPSVENDFNETGDASGTYPIGTTTVNWIATNANANTTSCPFDVTVEGCTNAGVQDLTCTATVNLDYEVRALNLYSGTVSNISGNDLYQVIDIDEEMILKSVSPRLTRNALYLNDPIDINIYEWDALTGLGVLVATKTRSSSATGIFGSSINFVGDDIKLNAGSYAFQYSDPDPTHTNSYTWDGRTDVSFPAQLPSGYIDRPSSVPGTFLGIDIKGSGCGDQSVNVGQPSATGYGPEGQAYDFTGTNSASDPAAFIPESGSFTVSVWAKERTVVNGDFRTFLAQGSNFYIGHDDQPDREIRIGDSWAETGVSFPSDGYWHNYTIVRDVEANNAYFYLDGTLAATRGADFGPPLPDPGETNEFVLGDQWNEGGGENFDGLLDEIRVYNRALSSSEVECNLSSEVGSDPSLVTYFEGANIEGINFYNFGLLGGWFIDNSVSTAESLTFTGRWTLLNSMTEEDYVPGVYPKNIIPDEIIWVSDDPLIEATCTTTLNVIAQDVCGSLVAVIVDACPTPVTMNLTDLGTPAELEASLDDNGDIRLDVTGSLATQGLQITPTGDNCDCPPGYAVTGYRGGGGDILDYFDLKCSKVNGDGSFGPELFITCGGFVDSGPWPLTEVNTAPSSYLVGFDIDDTNFYPATCGRTINGIGGYANAANDILANEVNDNGTTIALASVQRNFGLNNGNLSDQQTSQAMAPAGHVIVGMQVDLSVCYTNSVRFKYARLADIITPIQVIDVDESTPIGGVNLDRTAYDNSDCGQSYSVSMSTDSGQEICSFQVDVTCPSGGRITTQKDYLESQFEISLAPNPSAGLVAIGLQGLQQDTEMIIMDITGRVIHKEDVQAKTIKVYVDVSEQKYQNGVHIVAFRIDGQLVTKKLVVLK